MVQMRNLTFAQMQQYLQHGDFDTPKEVQIKWDVRKSSLYFGSADEFLVVAKDYGLINKGAYWLSLNTWGGVENPHVVVEVTYQMGAYWLFYLEVVEGIEVVRYHVIDGSTDFSGVVINILRRQLSQEIFESYVKNCLY